MPVYEKRRAVVKAIPKFWPVALMNHGMFALHAQHNADQIALSYLEDLWLTRDSTESRCFTLEFVRLLFHVRCGTVADVFTIEAFQREPVLFKCGAQEGV